MKRMSEVFELPVSDLDVFYSIHSVTDAETHAAYAINHVDALADALEMMIDMYCEGNLPNKATLDACSALAAYRGDK